MITATFNDNGFIIKGHANYAPRGQDIICAGVSAIVGATLITAEENEIEFNRVKCENGHIECDICSSILLDVVRYGVEAIAEQYPEHIRVVMANESKD